MAIDFTASNGNPSSRASLHYLGQGNQYIHAIEDVGSIIEPYDYDKMFPTFGFGAVPPGLGTVEHCFPLNSNPNDPSIPGILNIVNIYKQ